MAPTTRTQFHRGPNDDQNTTSATIAAIAPAVVADAVLTQRNTRTLPEESSSTTNTTEAVQAGKTPSVYTIDLSLPPDQRYVKLATDYKEQIVGIIHLFDEVVAPTGLPVPLVKRICRLALRRLQSKEQTAELRGIHKAVGVEMYLLVAFNTLLDLFMGCTSGGIKIKDGRGTRMVHFRTLDWGMDVLRNIIVQLQFVEHSGGPVIARSVTYAGFVGVLTGVRDNLSVSLNFRPYHNDSSYILPNIRFYAGHVLMLLGFRPSISSHLRDLVIPSCQRSPAGEKSIHLKTLATIVSSFPPLPTTAAYIILSDGVSTSILEKDLRTAVTHTSSTFLVTTNHDTANESELRTTTSQESQPTPRSNALLADFMAESVDRKACMKRRWDRVVQQHLKRSPGSVEANVTVRLRDVIRWTQGYPTTNESTHYACVMDPTFGEVAWVEKYEVDT